MINKIVCPLVVGFFFYTNIRQSPCLMDNHDSSQLDSYTPPNYYWTFYASYKPSQQTLPWLELEFVVQLFVHDLSFECVQKTHITIITNIQHSIIFAAARSQILLLALTQVNWSLDKIGLPVNWLTNIHMKKLNPLPLHKMNFTLDWEGMSTHSCSSLYIMISSNIEECTL